MLALLLILQGSRIEAYELSEPIRVAPVKTDDAIKAYNRILAGAGAIFPVRDIVDKRVINHVITGTGKIIDSQDEVGGWPELKSAMAPKDSDHDGMPDNWELLHKLNPEDGSDAGKISSGSSHYTNIELYINGLVAEISKI